MTNGKMRKFKNTPFLFIKDAIVNNIFAKDRVVLKEDFILPEINNNQYNIQDISNFNFNYLIEKLKNSNFNGIYMNNINRQDLPILGILDKDKKEFYISFIKLMYSLNILIEYKVANRYIKLKSINTFWKYLRLKNSLSIKLINNNNPTESSINRFIFKLDFWKEFEDFYNSEYINNNVSRKLWKKEAVEKGFFQNKGVKNYNKLLNYTNEIENTQKIDLVFTWVNSEDEDWKILYQKYNPKVMSDANSESRFKSRDELKYALRSWDKYGKFINNIYIVSNCKPPEWFKPDENIRWVYHEEIIEEKYLPTFSSHTIEACLHKIKGLSEYFIYSNDDFFLLKETLASDFYFANGIVKVKLEKYGNINGKVQNTHADYMNASINSNQLLEETFQRTTTKLHTHSPQPMRKSLIEEMEKKYESSFIDTKKNKFRGIEDINVTGHLAHHYYLLSGNAIDISDNEVILIQPSHKNFKYRIDKIIENNKKNSSLLPTFLCLNDGGNSHLNKKWNDSINYFLDEIFYDKSKYEI